MVATIAPVVYGRRSDYLAAVIVHIVAATITAAATGAVLALVGRGVGAPWHSAGAAIVGLVASIYLMREAFGLPVPLPNARRQVPEWWRTFFSPIVAAGLYGAGLGVAFATFLSFGTFVAVAAAAVASGDPVTGAAITAPFGAARGLAVALSAARWRDPNTAVSAVEDRAATALPRAINAAVLGIVAALAFTSS